MGTVFPTSAINTYTTSNTASVSTTTYDLILQQLVQQQSQQNPILTTGPLGGGGSGIGIYNPGHTHINSNYGILGGPTTVSGWSILNPLPMICPPTGNTVKMLFRDANGDQFLMDVDEAYVEIIEMICQKHASINAKKGFMEKGDFSVDEIERAGDLIEQLAQKEGSVTEGSRTHS